MAPDYLSSHSYTETVKFHVLMTTHNRVEHTRKCLQVLDESLNQAGAKAQLYLVDAASTDQTLDEASRVWARPLVSLSESDQTFWAGGMELAESLAWRSNSVHDSDYLMWLNDDVFLDGDALLRATAVIEGGDASKPAVFVGALRGSSGSVTYGGIKRSALNPLGIKMIKPNSSPQAVDTFHGNFVLVPALLAKQLAPIDGAYGHHMADIDYGIRSTKAGYRNVLMPGTYGVCDTSEAELSSLADAWRHYLSIRGGGHWPTRRRFMVKHSALPSTPLLLAMDVVHFARLLIFRPTKLVRWVLRLPEKVGPTNG